MRMKDDAWEAVINANLTGVFRLTKACVRAMLKAKSGRIINITSVVGLTGNAGQANYAASKAGVIAFTKSLAREIGSRNITVNAIAPGFVETDMTHALPEEHKAMLLQQIPLNRAGTGQDVAAAVVFLASAAASYVTGETLHVNGGMYMA
jgi:3-oxoacyl-[acyl-carrier protein] reductase